MLNIKNIGEAFKKTDEIYHNILKQLFEIGPQEWAAWSNQKPTSLIIDLIEIQKMITLKEGYDLEGSDNTQYYKGSFKALSEIVNQIDLLKEESEENS